MLRAAAAASVLVLGLGLSACGGAAPRDDPGAGTAARPPTSAPALPSTPSVPSASPASSPRPERLLVPSVGIDSTLVDLDVAADGTLEVPQDYQLAGWFAGGPVPGDRGPAVLAGHVDSRSGPAVFYRLDEVEVGDEVVVVGAGGKQVRFSVDGVERYAKDAFPTELVYGPAPGPVLRLITCGGTFDRSTGHYRDNVVVYATRTGL